MSPPGPPAILVCGLGRCGSSLTMQMLAAGGAPCVGTFPDFEEQPALDGELPAAWLEAGRGKAAKLLNPQWLTLPASAPPLAVIWLSRDPRQQARSQAKLANMAAGLPRASRAHVRRWEFGIARDTIAASHVLMPRATCMLMLRYEDILSHPGIAASELANFVAPWIPGIHPHPMAAAVRKHDPHCAPDMAMEERLLAEAGARR